METTKPLTQAQRILHYLQEGNTITTLEALNYFGCFRLASRISELRSEGHPIVTDMITTPTTKKQVARYRLAGRPVQLKTELVADKTELIEVPTKTQTP